jgi:hypothetical protein
LTCISFMGRDGEHFFMCFLAIWIDFKKFIHVSIFHFTMFSLELEMIF